jgi:hypothetical protein
MSLSLIIIIEKGFPDNDQKYDFYHELKETVQMGDGQFGLGKILEEYEIVFENTNQAQQFINLLMDASNNTRLWANKGFTPEEMSSTES